MRIIETNKLNLRYNNRQILSDVSLTLKSGRITTLIGPNGAGKSSAFRILAGLVKPEKGTVRLDDIQLQSFEELRNHCGYLLESPDFYSYLSGKENLELLIQISKSKTDSEKLLQLVGLQNEGNKKVQHYSRGMKQRLGFAQVLINDPDFLILDEPFNGLDPEVKTQMLAQLVTLKNEGKGILVSTHLLEDMETIADDFVLLNKGRVYLKSNMEDNLNEKQKVVLHFSKSVKNLKQYYPENLFENNKIILMATISETEALLNDLYKQNFIPFRISRSSILHDKYMEITNESAN